MSQTSILRSSRQDKSVKFLEFMRLQSRDKNQLCCFFEGDDAKYYGVRISTLLPGQQWSPINCCGKTQVLELFTLISKHPDYATTRTAFFVDRDFDSPLPADLRQKIYETPCYSIENFYTSENCFKQILKSEFGITDGTQDGSVLDNCYRLFQTTQNSFHEAITDLNAWIWMQRNHNNNSVAINLRDVKFDRFIAISLGSVNKLYSMADLSAFFPAAPTVDGALWAEKISEFKNCDRRSLFRGKYEAEFLRLVLMKLAEDYRSNPPRHFPVRGTVRLTLSRENLISELSQYADTPKCLRDYLLSLN